MDTIKTVTAEEYMEVYAAAFYEWVDGRLIEMSPASLRHEALIKYVLLLLETYFDIRSSGVVVTAPFVMQVDTTHSRREPDLQVILHENPGQLTATAMVGPADICIEVVSPESSTRDRGEKFTEYEAGGVREYWLLDLLREEASFYRLTTEGVYQTILTGREGTYTTPLLSDLHIDVATLWQETLPGIRSVVQSVQAMLEG